MTIRESSRGISQLRHHDGEVGDDADGNDKMMMVMMGMGWGWW
jgi:hypothetical protein